MSAFWRVEIPNSFVDDEAVGSPKRSNAFQIFDFRFSTLSSAADADPLNLTEPERDRAAKFHQRIDRNRFTVGRSILRQALGKILDLPPLEVPIEVERGRPVLELATPPPLFFNISHSGSYVMLILSRHYQVGIDVEVLRDFPDMDQVAKRVMTDEEYNRYIELEPTRQSDAFYRLWVRKESILKCMGTGFEIEPRRITVGHDTSPSTGSSFEGQRYQSQQYIDKECEKPHYWAFTFAGQCTQIQLERYPIATQFI